MECCILDSYSRGASIPGARRTRSIAIRGWGWRRLGPVARIGSPHGVGFVFESRPRTRIPCRGMRA
jgi:hypothetical protein